jgi:CBS domain containing-hemolysin-like protein
MVFPYLYSFKQGVFANFLIISLLVLFYKIKYLNFASFFIARMFLIISEIIPLTLIILGTEIIFAYSYKIIYEI